MAAEHRGDDDQVRCKGEKELVGVFQRDKLLYKNLEHVGYALEDTGRTYSVRTETALEGGTHLTLEIDIEKRQKSVCEKKHDTYEHTLDGDCEPGGAKSV